MMRFQNKYWRRMSVVLHQMLSDLEYIFLNYFVANIPCWHIRKFFYKAFGMSIGKSTRIHMKCIVLAPRRISIGERTVINERCFLDGRGGLQIGNDSSISVFSMLITGSHSKSSPTFAYRPGPIKIGDNVWLGSRAIVLDNSELMDKAIIGAGSVFKGIAEENTVYIGVPAVKANARGLCAAYKQTYKPYFR